MFHISISTLSIRGKISSLPIGAISEPRIPYMQRECISTPAKQSENPNAPAYPISKKGTYLVYLLVISIQPSILYHQPHLSNISPPLLYPSTPPPPSPLPRTLARQKIARQQASPLRDLHLRIRLLLALDIQLALPGPPAPVEPAAPHGADDDGGDQPDEGDGEEIVDEEAQSPAARGDGVFDDAVVAGADGAAAEGLEAGPEGAGDVSLFGAELVLAVVGARVVSVAPVAAVVEPGDGSVGGQGRGREGVGLGVWDGADGVVGAGGYGGVVVVRVYVQEGVPEGAFVCLVAKNAEGEDVVLNSRRWVHCMGAGCGIYYRLDSLLADEMDG
jgi:hypothetical protein